MAHEQLTIEIAGREIPELYAGLDLVEVELDEELAGMFRLTVVLVPRTDGSFDLLDDARLAPWQRVRVLAGAPGGQQELIDGHITHVHPEFGEDLEDCRLHLWGIDATVLMDRVDVVKAWPGMADSDIAQQILTDHHLDAKVTGTTVIHQKDVSTVLQRETDMQFLRRLAGRNGYDCYVTGRTGWFGPRTVPAATTLPILAVHFGERTNVIRLALTVDALAPIRVSMAQAERTRRQSLRVTSTAVPGGTAMLGARPPDDYLPAGTPPASVRVRQAVTTGQSEMQALCDGLNEEASWFVTGEGEVDGNRYGGVLMPRARITVKGVGRTYSGDYLVSRVTHTFTPDGYRQVFGVKRNALLPTGTERFEDAEVQVAAITAAAAELLAELQR